MQTVKKWRQHHKGPTTIVISSTNPWRLKPSTAASIAGALECAIYGRLLETPAVYVGLNMMLGLTRADRHRRRYYYISHGRAANMLVKSMDIRLLRGPACRVSLEEGVEIWEQARAKTRDPAP